MYGPSKEGWDAIFFCAVVGAAVTVFGVGFATGSFISLLMGFFDFRPFSLWWPPLAGGVAMLTIIGAILLNDRRRGGH